MTFGPDGVVTCVSPEKQLPPAALGLDDDEELDPG